jgi:hypothetical protein
VAVRYPEFNGFLHTNPAHAQYYQTYMLMESALLHNLQSILAWRTGFRLSSTLHVSDGCGFRAISNALSVPGLEGPKSVLSTRRGSVLCLATDASTLHARGAHDDELQQRLWDLFGLMKGYCVLVVLDRIGNRKKVSVANFWVWRRLIGFVQSYDECVAES